MACTQGSRALDLLKSRGMLRLRDFTAEKWASALHVQATRLRSGCSAVPRRHTFVEHANAVAA